MAGGSRGHSPLIGSQIGRSVRWQPLSGQPRQFESGRGARDRRDQLERRSRSRRRRDPDAPSAADRDLPDEGETDPEARTAATAGTPQGPVNWLRAGKPVEDARRVDPRDPRPLIGDGQYNRASPHLGRHEDRGPPPARGRVRCRREPGRPGGGSPAARLRNGRESTGGTLDGAPSYGRTAISYCDTLVALRLPEKPGAPPPKCSSQATDCMRGRSRSDIRERTSTSPETERRPRCCPDSTSGRRAGELLIEPVGGPLPRSVVFQMRDRAHLVDRGSYFRQDRGDRPISVHPPIVRGSHRCGGRSSIGQ